MLRWPVIFPRPQRRKLNGRQRSSAIVPTYSRAPCNQRTHTVGVMVFDMTDPYCTPILRGIENALYQASFLPILTDVHSERSRFERYLEMLLDRRVEGLIVLANWLFVDIDVLADLEKSSIPTA